MIITNKNTLQLCQLNQDDLKGLIDLSDSVGWDYDEAEISTVLASGKIFGHRTSEGRIVSSAAIIPYDTNLASIGMVIVHHEYRGLGLAKIVTQQCIQSVSKETAIMLIATEEGKPLYEKIGFRTVDSVHKYLCDHYSYTEQVHNDDVNIEIFRDTDLQEVIELDQAAFGDRRNLFLQNRIKQSHQCVVMKDQHNHIIGFGVSVFGPVHVILGPIVAPNAESAAYILDRLAKPYNRRLRIDVPSCNEEFMLFLEQSGFKKVSNPPIMMIHAPKMPTRNHSLFGIAAQIFG